ncbi:MAG TPA: universal stress protein [Actinomycetota bacterium]|nr:universal stress protein [Actinomycetota bacterium]
MFDKILLAVDGSEHSERATAAAADLATKSAGTVYVLHVHEAGLVAPVETNTEAKVIVDQAMKQLEADGVQVTGDAVSARSGSIAPTIIEAARSLGSDLIVMGTRGLSDFSGLLVGSIAHKVIQHADCPVLVVR